MKWLTRLFGKFRSRAQETLSTVTKPATSSKPAEVAATAPEATEPAAAEPPAKAAAAPTEAVPAPVEDEAPADPAINTLDREREAAKLSTPEDAPAAEEPAKPADAKPADER